MPKTLRIGPVAIDQRLDASDPDEVGGLAGPLGAGLDGLAIIQAGARAYESLTPLQGLRRDEDRSAQLDLDEVKKVSEDPGEIEGASVRGTNADQLVVIFLSRRESGRSTKGMVPYADLPKSRKAYDEWLETEVSASRAARAAGGSEESFGEDPRVETLTKKLDQLSDKVSAEAEARKAAEKRAKDAESLIKQAEKAVKDAQAETAKLQAEKDKADAKDAAGADEAK